MRSQTASNVQSKEMKTDSTVICQSLQKEIDTLAVTALREDLGLTDTQLADSASLTGAHFLARDITSNSIIPADRKATGTFIVKGEGVVAGIPVAIRLFELVDPSAKLTIIRPEGSSISAPPVTIAKVEGSAQLLLLVERTALNIMQRLSGIATVTRKFAQKAEGTGIQILDTRKTTPGLRALEKYAVTVGGGTNHRFGLYDAILIKDNHISIAGGVTQAIAAARKHTHGMPVEVEVSNTAELEEALKSGAEKIMLDNMTPEQVKQAVALVAGKAFIEVSGGINWQSIDSYLIPGVNAISVGALTHSVTSLDISLEIEG
jgi:nicotinate-nucleotide pyrophosphorylase (carboxylating)